MIETLYQVRVEEGLFSPKCLFRVITMDKEYAMELYREKCSECESEGLEYEFKSESHDPYLGNTQYYTSYRSGSLYKDKTVLLDRESCALQVYDGKIRIYISGEDKGLIYNEGENIDDILKSLSIA